jgi:hypothetical protein
MYSCFRAWAVLALIVAGLARAAGPSNPPSPEARAVERGLAFLQKDAAAWRKERKCATCHHGTMTLWALCEAKEQGYGVQAEAIADVAKWTKERLERIDLPRDKRPGWSMVNTPSLYLSALAVFVPKQQAVSADELKRIAGHLLRHQEADGAWSWASAPPKNRPPPFFESDEVATLLGYVALGLHPKPDVRAAREKATAWLKKTKPSDTTQAMALRLLVKSREKPTGLRPEIDALLGRQNKDGGWGQLKGAASDAYATGQALYVLRLAGVPKDRAEVKRGVAFLVGRQKPDGSWPMVSRAHAGATPGKNPVPIVYFGSAWATLGLMRSVAE